MAGSSTGAGAASPSEGIILLCWAEPRVQELPRISRQGCYVPNAARMRMLSADNLSSEPIVSLGGRRGQLDSGREQEGSVSQHPPALLQLGVTPGSLLAVPWPGRCQVHSPGCHAVIVGRRDQAIPGSPVCVVRQGTHSSFSRHRILVWMSPLSAPWWESTARRPSSSSLSTAAV